MHGSIRRVGPGLAAALLAVPSVAPGQTVHYAYDAAGRLSVVADPRGDLAVYSYDAVGNLSSIQRLGVSNLPDAVVIAHVMPDMAPRGATVAIFGKGFGAAPDANVVSFNDVPAAVLTASPTRLTVRVPPTATSGPILLGTPLGAAASAAFHVLDALSITPPTAVIAPRGQVRFTASGAGTRGVRWSVDRVAGGDPQRGTIDADGVYVAPETLPAGGVRITATSVVAPAMEATALVSMIVSLPLFVGAEPVVIAFPAPSRHVERTATASLAVASTTSFAMAAPLAIGVAPVILGVTPPTGARGEALQLVVAGAGFEGATRLELWTGAGPDATLTVSDLAVTGDGREATADVAVSLDAPPGPRIVRIFTATGSSADIVAGDNLFTVR
jgi:hypothetical protein